MITVTKWSRLAVEITFHAAFVFHCLPALTALINGIFACCVPRLNSQSSTIIYISSDKCLHAEKRKQAHFLTELMSAV